VLWAGRSAWGGLWLSRAGVGVRLEWVLVPLCSVRVVVRVAVVRVAGGVPLVVNDGWIECPRLLIDVF
jgi:hypothetical protein